MRGYILFLVDYIDVSGLLVTYVIIAAAQVLSPHAASCDRLLCSRGLWGQGLDLLIIHRLLHGLLLLSVQRGHLLLGLLIPDLLLVVLELLLGEFRLLVEFDDTDEADEADDSDDASDTSRAGGFRQLRRVARLDVVALARHEVPEPPDIWQHRKS